MKKLFVAAGVAAALVVSGNVMAETAQHAAGAATTGSWTGWLKQKDATSLTFVDEKQQTHEVLGTKEADLLKNFKDYENKKVKVTGVLKTEGVEISAVTTEMH